MDEEGRGLGREGSQGEPAMRDDSFGMRERRGAAAEMAALVLLLVDPVTEWLAGTGDCSCLAAATGARPSFVSPLAERIRCT